MRKKGCRLLSVFFAMLLLLECLYVPGAVRAYADEIMVVKDGVTYLCNTDTLEAAIVAYDSSAGTWDGTIPQSVTDGEEGNPDAMGNSYTVTAIGENAFRGADIGSVSGGESVLSIGNYAFADCANLCSVEISNATSLGEGAFYGCTSLGSVSFHPQCTEIPAYAFYNCTSLSLSGLPDQLESIGESAFEGDSSLSVDVFPQTLTSIGANAFKGTGFMEIILPDTLTSIGEGAFGECYVSITPNESAFAIGIGKIAPNASAVVLPEGMKAIPASCFAGSVGLTTMEIPDTVTEIGANAFANCSSLETITIGKNVTSIGEGAFAGYNAELFKIKCHKYSAAYQYALANGCATEWIAEQLTENNTVIALGNIGVYGGEAVCPEVTVKVDGKILTQKDDYTVSYEGNNGAGRNAAKAVITGAGCYAGTLEKTFSIGLGVPEAVSYVPTATSIDLRWVKVPGAEKYEILRSSSENGEYVLIGESAQEYVSDLQDGKVWYHYTDEGLNKETDYYYKVRAVKGSGAAKISGEASGNFAAGTKKSQVIQGETDYSKAFGDEPFSLNLKAQNSNKIPMGYQSDHPEIAAVDADGTVTIRGVGKAVITVTAYGDLYYEETELQICVNVMPGVSDSVICDTNRANQMGVIWKEIPGADKYEILRSMKADGVYTKIGESTDRYNGYVDEDAEYYFYMDTGLSENTVYYYKIRGITEIEGGEVAGELSAAASGRTRKIQKIGGTLTYHKYMGDPDFTLSLTAPNSNRNKFSYTSKNPSVATVDANGKVTIVGTGTAVITVIALADSQYEAAETNVTVSVSNKKSLANATVKLSFSEEVYTGKAICPQVTVYDGRKLLKKGTHYTVSYKNNVKVGKASVTVKGSGIYTGSLTRYFTIVAKPSAVTGLKMSSSSTSSVKLSWRKKANVAGYRIYTYRASKKKYVYTRTVKGNTVSISKLSAGKTYKFKVYSYAVINKKTVLSGGVSVQAATKPARVTSLSLKAGSRRFTAKWKKVSSCSGYEIKYSTSSKFSSSRTKTVRVSSKNKSKVIQSLGRKKNYYVKICAYVNLGGKRICGSYSKVKRIKTK